MKKATALSITCALALLACERKGEDPNPEATTGQTTGAAAKATVGPPSRDWTTPAPAADAELEEAIATFARECPNAVGCAEDVRGELANATRVAFERGDVAAVGALAMAASRGGADALAAGSLVELLRGSELLDASSGEALEPAARRLLEVWRALSTSTASGEAVALSELTARVALAAGMVEPMLDASKAASSDEARGALLRWSLLSGDEQAYQVLVEVWDSRREPEAVRASAARAVLELEEWPGSWSSSLCEQARNQLEGGDPKLARWWAATLWRCDGDFRAIALAEANRRFELHTFDASFAQAFSQGPCASEASAGLSEARKSACEGPRGVLERALEDAEVAPEVKADAARAIARGWPDAGARATLERALKSSDEVVSKAAKEALEALRP